MRPCLRQSSLVPSASGSKMFQVSFQNSKDASMRLGSPEGTAWLDDGFNESKKTLARLA